jgi:hypothetical protein
VLLAVGRGHRGISQKHLRQTNSSPQQDKASSWPHYTPNRPYINPSSEQIRTAVRFPTRLVLSSNLGWDNLPKVSCCFLSAGELPRLSHERTAGYRSRGPGFDSRRYQVFWEVVGLERGPLSLLSTTEELLERKSSGSSLENREYCLRDSSRWPRGTLYPQQLRRQAAAARSL